MIQWWAMPGDPNNLFGKANEQLFKLHIGHGRIWYAFELTRAGSPIAAKAFDGPEPTRRAREWCEARISTSNKRGRSQRPTTGKPTRRASKS